MHSNCSIDRRASGTRFSNIWFNSDCISSTRSREAGRGMGLTCRPWTLDAVDRLRSCLDSRDRAASAGVLAWPRVTYSKSNYVPPHTCVGYVGSDSAGQTSRGPCNEGDNQQRESGWLVWTGGVREVLGSWTWLRRRMRESIKLKLAHFSLSKIITYVANTFSFVVSAIFQEESVNYLWSRPN